MDYDCIGICQPDPESGLCEGCGRPYFDAVETQVASDDIQASNGASSNTGATPCSSS